MEQKTERNYKDNLFRMIFRDKQELLSLYNAMNNTYHTNPEDLEINTLENAIYMNMKNDVSFVCGFYLNLYEHQSTYNPNMPLRNLFYAARLFERIVSEKSLYSTIIVQIPTPKFVVFYNGTDKQPERQILKLSDAYQVRQESPELELEVTMLNINIGNNQQLMEQCRTLNEYMMFVEKVRAYAKIMEIELAVVRAVDECISAGILKGFLSKYRAEAIQMSIFEYDEEKELKLMREAEREAGREAGREVGKHEFCIKTIRRTYEEGMDVSQISKILDTDEGYVKRIIELLQTYPLESDIQLVKHII